MRMWTSTMKMRFTWSVVCQIFKSARLVSSELFWDVDNTETLNVYENDLFRDQTVRDVCDDSCSRCRDITEKAMISEKYEFSYFSAFGLQTKDRKIVVSDLFFIVKTTSKTNFSLRWIFRLVIIKRLSNYMVSSWYSAFDRDFQDAFLRDFRDSCSDLSLDLLA